MHWSIAAKLHPANVAQIVIGIQTPTEHCLQRVCREAGAVVQPNAYLRDMNIGVRSADARRIEVLASGLPCFGGAQLAVDITLRHYLTATGAARALANERGNRLLAEARHDKERTYHELLRSRRCKLVVVALSTGGRWSTEALGFIHTIA